MGRSLRELNAKFLKTENNVYFHTTSRAEADGVMFLCPVCFEANGGRVGTHSIICWAPNVPPEFSPGPGRWSLIGDSLGDLTLKGRTSDSVAVTGGCAAHFFVRNGSIDNA